MPTAAVFEYYKATERIATSGGLSLADAAIKVALMATAYTPDQAVDEKWSDISADEISDASYGGPVAILGVGSLNVNTYQRTAGGIVTFPTLAVNFRWAVMLIDNAPNDWLLCYYDPGSEQAPGGLDVDIQWPANLFATLART